MLLILKILTIFLLSFLNACQSLKDGLQGNKKSKSAEEFLIEKKNPLVLPPDFDNLPEPQKKSVEDDITKKNIDLSGILNKSKDKEQVISKESKSLQKSISKILNRN